MDRFRRFLRLPFWQRRLLVRAALAVGAIRLGLSLLPFRLLQGLLAPLTAVRAVADQTGRPPVDRVVWAVEVAGRYVPRATCLTQALAAQLLLARQDYPTRLRIGVGRDAAGRFEAHAWLEDDHRVLLGAAEAGRFTPFAALEGGKP